MVAGHAANTALNTHVLIHLLDLAEDKMSCQVQNSLNYCGANSINCMVTSASCLPMPLLCLGAHVPMV